MYDEPQHVDVCFLFDEWKSSKGGCSTIITKFALHIAEMERFRVNCLVSQSDHSDKDDAKRNGVNLISAMPRPCLDPLDWLKFPPPEIQQTDVVIGHGRMLGSAAYFIKERTNCKLVQFVHDSSEDVGRCKGTESHLRDVIKEIKVKHEKDMIELCKAADRVVAIGSLLQEMYQKSLPDIKVETITPGILEEFSYHSTQQPEKPGVFTVFVFGRGTCEDFKLKGYDIIGNAIASLGGKFELHFAGSPPCQHTAIRYWFQNKSKIATEQLTVHGYCTLNDFKDMLSEADVVVLPSRMEGFGMIALGALSAGVPVLVSNQSGIAKALENVNGGDLVVVNPENAKEWAEKIQQLSKQTREERLNDAKRLRENYSKTYSWSTQFKRFERMIQDLVEEPPSFLTCTRSTSGHKDASGSGVYCFIRDLIVEGKDAMFVNDTGRYAINWLTAPVRYQVEFKSGNDNISSRKASNNLRSTLLNCNEKEGAKEYKECRKRNDKGQVIERQFQMPPRIFKSLFRSDLLFMDHGPSEQELGSIASKACNSSRETPDSRETRFDEEIHISHNEFAEAKAKDISCDEKNKIQLTESKSLHLSAKGGNVAIIEELLSQGCDINARDSDEKTPLMIAAFHGKAEVVSFLLKDGADAFLKSEDGSTLLHFASWGGNVTIIEKVVKQGLHIDSTDSDDNTPLMYAAFDGRIQVVNCLLMLGADPFLEGRFGRNSLHWASSSGNIHVMEALLLRGVEVDSRDWSGKSPLMYAASLGKEEAVTYLLHKGANPSLESNLGKNLLHFSSQGGSIPIIEAMLSHGLDINSRDDDGNTPLTMADTFCKVEAMEYLLSKGAGQTPCLSVK